MAAWHNERQLAGREWRVESGSWRSRARNAGSTAKNGCATEWATEEHGAQPGMAVLLKAGQWCGGGLAAEEAESGVEGRAGIAAARKNAGRRDRRAVASF